MTRGGRRWIIYFSGVQPSLASSCGRYRVFSSPKEEEHRFSTDYGRVNAVMVPVAYPLPRIHDLVVKVGPNKYISEIYLLKGYYQILFTDNAQQISTFITPFGLLQCPVMPFGMRNAPSTFQRVVDYLLLDLSGVSVYLDDFMIFTWHWEQHLIQLREVLTRLQGAHLPVKLAKTIFSKATVTYLGHEVGQGRVRLKRPTSPPSWSTLPLPLGRLFGAFWAWQAITGGSVQTLRPLPSLSHATRVRL